MFKKIYIYIFFKLKQVKIDEYMCKHLKLMIKLKNQKMLIPLIHEFIFYVIKIKG